MSDIMDKIVVTEGAPKPAAEAAVEAQTEEPQQTPPAEGTAPKPEEDTKQDKDGDTVPENSDDKAPPSEEDKGDDSSHNQKKVERKIGKIVSQREKQRARAEAAEQHIVELQKKLEELKSTAEKTDRSQMTYSDRIDHDVRLATEQRFAEQQIQAAGREVAEAQADVWQSQVDEFSATHPDFYEVVRNAKIPISPELQSALFEMGPSYVYALANDPQTAERISQTRNPIVIATLLNGLTAQTQQSSRADQQTPPSAPVTKPRVTTPAPGAPTSVQPQKKPWELDIAEYMASQRKKGLIR